MQMMFKTLPLFQRQGSKETWEGAVNILSLVAFEPSTHLYEEGQERKMAEATTLYFVGGPPQGIKIASPIIQFQAAFANWMAEFQQMQNQARRSQIAMP